MDLLSAALPSFGRRRSSIRGGVGDPAGPLLWEGWITKAGESHKSWKNRYARVHAMREGAEGTAAPPLILRYFPSDAASAREKGRLVVSDLTALVESTE